MRERQESRVFRFLASTAGWVVVSVTEMERLEGKLVWERIKSLKCMKLLSKKEER